MEPLVVPASHPTHSERGPSFAVMARQPMRPSAVLLAMMIAGGVIWLVAAGLGHGGARHFRSDEGGGATRTPGGSSSAAASDPKADQDDKDDDPSQVDTIVLGDAADAPVPATKRHISNVHASVIVHLPRFGPESGLIPDSPAGHLLFRWLAAFNSGTESALAEALPNDGARDAAAAQLALRMETGGFRLLSAKEIEPGLMMFRLRDQMKESHEVLGTLAVRPKSEPAAVGSFSLRMVEVKKVVAANVH